MDFSYVHIRYFIGYVYHICLQDTIQSTLSLCLRCQAMLLPMPLRPLLLTTRSGFTSSEGSGLLPFGAKSACHRRKTSSPSIGLFWSVASRGTGGWQFFFICSRPLKCGFWILCVRILPNGNSVEPFCGTSLSGIGRCITSTSHGHSLPTRTLRNFTVYISQMVGLVQCLRAVVQSGSFPLFYAVARLICHLYR